MMHKIRKGVERAGDFIERVNEAEDEFWRVWDEGQLDTSATFLLYLIGAMLGGISYVLWVYVHPLSLVFAVIVGALIVWAHPVRGDGWSGFD